MKIASIIGARPQFVKASPLSRELKLQHNEILIHTGQHYDKLMSECFFIDLDIPKPNYNLEVGSGSHTYQVANMLLKLEEIFLKEKPDIVLVYGDTNSTLAGSLAAIQANIPLAHIESGMRSFDKTMPEEANRITSDHLSDICFCSTQTAVDNLAKEGIQDDVYLVGDVMVDALYDNLKKAERSDILRQLNIRKDQYYLATIHRASNTDNSDNLKNILEAFSELDKPVVLPLHPRTKKAIAESFPGELKNTRIKCIDPVSYLDMLQLEKNAHKILTDSGGIQKEAFILQIPCITLRETTEWVETIKCGCNILTGADKSKIISAAGSKASFSNSFKSFYGDGNASQKIKSILDHWEKADKE